MEKYYRVLECSSNINLKDLKKQYFNLMRQTHPDRGNDDKRCKEINEAYQKILEYKLNGMEDNEKLSLIPQKFREMGFDKIPTVDQYVRELIKSSNKLNDKKKCLEGEEILKIENVKTKSLFDKIFDFFFQEDD